jgi:hypothetical protein
MVNSSVSLESFAPLRPSRQADDLPERPAGSEKNASFELKRAISPQKRPKKGQI